MAVVGMLTSSEVPSSGSATPLHPRGVMATFLSNSSGSRLPEDGALDRLVARLASVRSSVGVIRLVERWATVRQPTRFAVIAESKAFIDLCLMDRAWVRLRELGEADADDAEVLALTAEMFIARGWPARAARHIEKLQALGLESERLHRIEQGASAPPVRPPSNARELERAGSFEEQIALAETFLATGSVLRARGLLERMSRTHGAQPRIQQLLWGLRGEFTAGQQDLSALVTELLTGLTSDGGWEASEPTASLDQGDPETAEASKVMRGWNPQQGERSPAFPSLFRFAGDETARAEDLEDDVTVAAVMASQEELVDPPTYEHSDPEGLIESGSADTQIMQVIGSGDNRRLAPVDGPVHNAAPPAKRGPVDLRAWRAEHGVASSDGLLTAPGDGVVEDFGDDDYFEEEDEDVVVMTRHEEPAYDPRTPVVRRSSIAVIEKVPEPPPPIPNLPGQDEDTPTVGPSPIPPEPASSVPTEPVGGDTNPDLPEQPDESVELEPVQIDAVSASRTSWVALGAVALILVLLFTGLLGVVLTRRWIVTSQSESVRTAVLDSHPDVLIPLRRELRQMHRDGGILAPAQSQLASSIILVDLALWEVVSGDPTTLNEALRLAEDGMAGPDSKLAMAWIDRVVGNGVSFDGLGDHPLVALLRAEEALDAGQWELAAKALEGTSSDMGARLAMAELKVREQAGPVPPEALSDAVRNHPLGRIWLYSRGDQSLSDQERVAMLKGLFASLPNEAAWLRARTFVAIAQIYDRSGRAEASASAWRDAMKINPHDALVLSHVAATSTKSADSVKWMRDCLKLVQSSPACQRGVVQVLLEMGKTGDAKVQVDAWRNAGIGVGLLGDWVALESGDRTVAVGVPDSSDPQRASFGLTRYLDALTQEREGARQSGLESAVKALRDSENPWDHRLASYIEQHRDDLVRGARVNPVPGG